MTPDPLTNALVGALTQVGTELIKEFIHQSALPPAEETQNPPPAVPESPETVKRMPRRRESNPPRRRERLTMTMNLDYWLDDPFGPDPDRDY